MARTPRQRRSSSTSGRRSRAPRASRPRTAETLPKRPREAETRKRPFDIHAMLDRIREAVRPFPKAALFELFEDGYKSLFEVLVACIISIRTRDETTVVVARQLFEAARTPEAVARLTPARIDGLIHACTFHEPKAEQIHEIAKQVAGEFGGELPCDLETMTSFRGVGPKCANLTLGIACGPPEGAEAAEGIGVDVHVHRVTNRWGYVEERTPEKTMASLQQKLPREYWLEINALLVPFGKHVCTGTLPRCSVCPVLEYCRQVGVDAHR